MKKHTFKVGQLVKQGKGPQIWSNPNQVLRIAKRERSKYYWTSNERYFVVAVGDKPGYGTWINEDRLKGLSPLDLLAMQMD